MVPEGELARGAVGGSRLGGGRRGDGDVESGDGPEGGEWAVEVLGFADDENGEMVFVDVFIDGAGDVGLGDFFDGGAVAFEGIGGVAVKFIFEALVEDFF